MLCTKNLHCVVCNYTSKKKKKKKCIEKENGFVVIRGREWGGGGKCIKVIKRYKLPVMR